MSQEFTQQLQAVYGMDPTNGSIAEFAALTCSSQEREIALVLRDIFHHYLALETKSDLPTRIAVLDRMVREQAFTVLNRLCALRMAEARGLLYESLAKGPQSQGFSEGYSRIAGASFGGQGESYAMYLKSLFDEFAVDLPVLFDRYSTAGLLFPGEAALRDVLAEINEPEISTLWSQDEAIGWIYQYFNSEEERKAMRDASQAPRNSRELAVRNQFFTPRYVVEFLCDNTLGRTWHEMTQGESSLADRCTYLVRQTNEIFLTQGEEAPAATQADADQTSDISLSDPVHIPFRPLKDPRDLKLLDPACGSMHFGLYAFDLFEQIYIEAWDLEASRGSDAFTRSEHLAPLHESYPDREAYQRDIPRLILERNIYGVDIDPRAVQIAALSLWLRAQRTWHDNGISAMDRPRIERSNIVCAEPMPGESDMLDEFLKSLKEDRLESILRQVMDVPDNQSIKTTERMTTALCELVTAIWDEMKLAGEAGSLLKIEEALSLAIAKGREEWEDKLPLFRVQEFGLGEDKPTTRFMKSGSSAGGDFWDRAEKIVLAALEAYANRADGIASSQRRMFAKDAAAGFAFINLSQQRFDVVVMNPPFGAWSKPFKDRSKKDYPNSYNDILGAFVDRGGQILVPGGQLGAITSRTCFFLSSFTNWRDKVVLDLLQPRLLVDLGHGVMDAAMVEAAAYVLEKPVKVPQLKREALAT
ncbi:MAG: SAM-dependent methyltransferase [Planctomycetota bacterium]|nr:SAM-dependent methyltransferase [Planctomycetota bacterium]MEC8799784.1 SAM-dependent methyltransferase [Planctomycetota bacterium]